MTKRRGADVSGSSYDYDDDAVDDDDADDDYSEGGVGNHDDDDDDNDDDNDEFISPTVLPMIIVITIKSCVTDSYRLRMTYKLPYLTAMITKKYLGISNIGISYVGPIHSYAADDHIIIHSPMIRFPINISSPTPIRFCKGS